MYTSAFGSDMQTTSAPDTSGLGALLIDQPESPALVDWLDQPSAMLVSSGLFETELRRIAVREGLTQSDVTRVLDGVALAALDRAVYRSAGFLPMPYLRTLETLHLEAAMRLDTAAILTYDHRLSEAARSAGRDVICARRGEHALSVLRRVWPLGADSSGSLGAAPLPRRILGAVACTDHRDCWYGLLGIGKPDVPGMPVASLDVSRAS